ncbi:hypothetical protein GQ44DRAFT_734491 [Phaeosphaeriaceae sp. PMI808]|nr:hypothetical protein GQ44DRAFT_734491 [Phaeosphaeriaceae sp. PMI808]
MASQTEIHKLLALIFWAILAWTARCGWVRDGIGFMEPNTPSGWGQTIWRAKNNRPYCGILDIRASTGWTGGYYGTYCTSVMDVYRNSKNSLQVYTLLGEPLADNFEIGRGEESCVCWAMNTAKKDSPWDICVYIDATGSWLISDYNNPAGANQKSKGAHKPLPLCGDLVDGPTVSATATVQDGGTLPGATVTIQPGTKSQQGQSNSSFGAAEIVGTIIGILSIVVGVVTTLMLRRRKHKREERSTVC